MALDSMEIARMARAHIAAASCKSTVANKAAKKIKVKAGSVRIGDKIGDSIVSGLGRIWSERVRDDDACVWGLIPGENHAVSFQYAYV